MCGTFVATHTEAHAAMIAAMIVAAHFPAISTLSQLSFSGFSSEIGPVLLFNEDALISVLGLGSSAGIKLRMIPSVVLHK